MLICINFQKLEFKCDFHLGEICTLQCKNLRNLTHWDDTEAVFISPLIENNIFKFIQIGIAHDLTNHLTNLKPKKYLNP